MTKQDAAITFANALIQTAQTMRVLRQQVNELLDQNTSEGYTTTLSNLATAAQNADGTLGTADGTPNTAHPISTTVYPTLSKAVSETMLANWIGDLNDFQSFLNNAAVATKNRAIDMDNLAS